jgi:hypothetical protein
LSIVGTGFQVWRYADAHVRGLGLVGRNLDVPGPVQVLGPLAAIVSLYIADRKDLNTLCGQRWKAYLEANARLNVYGMEPVGAVRRQDKSRWGLEMDLNSGNLVARAVDLDLAGSISHRTI